MQPKQLEAAPAEAPAAETNTPEPQPLQPKHQASATPAEAPATELPEQQHMQPKQLETVPYRHYNMLKTSRHKRKKTIYHDAVLSLKPLAPLRPRSGKFVMPGIHRVHFHRLRPT